MMMIPFESVGHADAATTRQPLAAWSPGTAASHINGRRVAPRGWLHRGVVTAHATAGAAAERPLPSLRSYKQVLESVPTLIIPMHVGYL